MQMAMALRPESSAVSFVVLEPVSAANFADAPAVVMAEVVVLAMKIFLSSLRLQICAN
jgi:hypothetical protein